MFIFSYLERLNLYKGHRRGPASQMILPGLVDRRKIP
jgi:hypothetical protein